MHGYLDGTVGDGLGSGVGGQVVVPPPRMVLEEPPWDAQRVSHCVQFLRCVSEQMTKVGVPQARFGVCAHSIDVAAHLDQPAYVAATPKPPPRNNAE